MEAGGTDDYISAGFFSVIEAVIGFFQEYFHIIRVIRESCYPEGGSQIPKRLLFLVGNVFFFNCRTELLGNQHCISTVAFRKDDHKFLTSKTSGEVTTTSYV